MAEINYAGEFIVSECILCTVGGLELDLTEQVASIAIFEDIFQNSITGNISFVDTNNLTANASIVGQEKLTEKWQSIYLIHRYTFIRLQAQ